MTGARRGSQPRAHPSRVRVTQPYLRVLAAFCAAVMLTTAVGLAVQAEFPAAAFALVVAVGLGWYGLVSPLRGRARVRRAETDALVARADAGHRAFRAGDMAGALAAPPSRSAAPRPRPGVVAAIAVAAVLYALFLTGVIGSL